MSIDNYDDDNYDDDNYDDDNYDDYFITYNGKLIPKGIDIEQFIYNNPNINISKFNNFEINLRQRGGGFEDIFTLFINLGKVFMSIGDFIEWLIKFVLWFIQFMMWVFTDLLNPLTLATEFLKSLMVIIITILKLPFDMIMGLFTFFINSVGNWMQGFWGWDQSSLTKEDKQSIYFKKLNKNKGVKAYLTNSNTVPFSIILGTLLCPPMGVFMDMGTTGWLNIVICILLTLAFYVPGLVYALLIIYS
jgi:uncharacterized membrane protein YqaE (UPF0057 family)